MTLSIDLIDDLAQLADGLQAVRLCLPSGEEIAIAAALARSTQRGEASPVGRRIVEPGVEQSDRIWHFSAAAVPTAPPLGATIVDSAGQPWTILATENQTFGTRWKCLTRNLAITAGLDTLVDVERAIFHKRRHGAAEATWLSWKPARRAKIQPRTVTEDSANSIHGRRASHFVYFAEDLPLGPEHRIVGPDGRCFRVLEVARAERIGELMRATVEKTAGPRSPSA